MYGDNGKYIIVQKGSLEEPIIFSPLISHEEMARKINAKVVSAGFINFRLECWGKSETLDIESREKDTELIRDRIFGTSAEDLEEQFK